MTQNIYIPCSIGIGFLGIAYPLGSDYEEEGYRGTHHLMEHLVYKSFEHLWPKLTRLGIIHNAYTASDKIAFHFSGIENRLVQVAEELYNLITSGKCYWTKEEFDTEKELVLQEYSDAFNEQLEGVITNTLRRYFGYYDTLGLSNDIVRFTYEDSLRLCDKFTAPEFVCQVGKKEYININGTRPKKKEFTVPRFYYHNIPTEPVPKQDQTVVGMLYKGAVTSFLYNKLSFVQKCLTAGLESPLYQALQGKSGLAYITEDNIQRVYDYCVPSFFSVTDNDKAKKLIKTYNEFFSGNLHRHISKERFENCMCGEMVSKETCDLLPFQGVFITVMEDNPFTCLDTLTYEDTLYLLDTYFKRECFEQIVY